MKVTYLYIAIVVIGLAVFLFFNTRAVSAPVPVPDSGTTAEKGNVDEFAQCLADAGAVFYGAFWCPHCQDQKKLFNESDKLPYVECSLPNGEGQTPVCIEEGIKGYPTWVVEMTGVRLCKWDFTCAGLGLLTSSIAAARADLSAAGLPSATFMPSLMMAR